LEGLVDGLNRKLTADALAAVFKPTSDAYRSTGAEQRLELGRQESEDSIISFCVNGFSTQK
jgi:hypothetical protein